MRYDIISQYFNFIRQEEINDGVWLTLAEQADPSYIGLGIYNVTISKYYHEDRYGFRSLGPAEERYDYLKKKYGRQTTY